MTGEEKPDFNTWLFIRTGGLNAGDLNRIAMATDSSAGYEKMMAWYVRRYEFEVINPFGYRPQVPCFYDWFYRRSGGKSLDALCRESDANGCHEKFLEFLALYIKRYRLEIEKLLNN